MFYSPLEQFTFVPILIFSNVSIYLLLLLSIFIILNYIHPYILQKHIEWWYPNFINIENKIFILLTIWLILLLSNLIGMIPYSLTLTAQTIIVLCISIPSFIAINLLGLKIHKWNIFYIFLPSGVPLSLIPLIIILEFIAYFVRVLSLTLRLCANMLSGHILIKIILYAFLSLNSLFSLILLPIIFLEIMVAILQAYVYILLIISYYQDILVSH